MQKQRKIRIIEPRMKLNHNRYHQSMALNDISEVQRFFFQDTGRELMPTDIKLYQMFGGEKVG